VSGRSVPRGENRPFVILLNAYDRVDDHRGPAVDVALLNFGETTLRFLAVGEAQRLELANCLMPRTLVSQKLFRVKVIEHNARFARWRSRSP
jgi:hypothetical protein